MPSAARRLDKLREAVAESPDSAPAHLKLGTALLRKSLLAAEKALLRATELDPQCIEAWVNLGGARLSRHDFKGCIEANRRAAECDPEAPLPHYNRGLGHMFLGQAEEMHACFQRVVEIDPEHAGGHFHVAAALLELGKIKEARNSLAKAMNLGYSPPPEFLRALARKSKEAGSPPEAPTIERSSTK